MTEYELATLALRTHTLWVTSAQVLVGAGQIAWRTGSWCFPRSRECAGGSRLFVP